MKRVHDQKQQSRARATVLSSLLALALVGGCAASHEADTADEITIAEIPAALAAAVCDIHRDCIGAFATRNGATLGGDASSCEDALEPLERNSWGAQILEAVDSGNATYDPRAAAECVSAIRALGCEWATRPLPEACRRMATGTRPSGAACTSSADCEVESYCDGGGSACAATCAPRKSLGAACRTSDECREGLGCDDGACATPTSRSGASCTSPGDGDCPLDEWCVGASGATPGTCTPISLVAVHTLGQTCGQDLRGCTPDLSCAITGTSGSSFVYSCVAVVAPGGRCHAAFPEMCPVGQVCDADPWNGSIEGTCRPEPVEGEPCFGSGRCPWDLACDPATDTCTAKRANGERCTFPQQCWSGYCPPAEGVCALQPVCL